MKKNLVSPTKTLVIGTNQLTAVQAQSAVKKAFPHVKTHLREYHERGNQEQGSREQKFTLELNLKANEKPKDVIETLLTQHKLRAFHPNGHESTLVIHDFTSFKH